MSDETFNCPEHGEFDSRKTWWNHGDECSAMCVECEPFHTGEVGCAYININMTSLENP